MAMLLAADIGGTKTDLALYGMAGEGFGPLHCQRYRNGDFTGLDQILEDFLATCDERPLVACLALAGVVDGPRVQLTNLPWVIDSRELARRYGFVRISLINDLTALAASIPSLEGADLVSLQDGREFPGEMRAIIAPGTGLGEGMLFDGVGVFLAKGSEGGHCDFAPVDEEQRALLAHVAREIRPVSYEALIAGPGLARLYRFCREYHGMDGDEAVASAMAGMADPIPSLLAAALRDEPCLLCRKVVDLFLAILGSETGNLALKLYARGGVYLGGGILPRLVGKVSFAGFLEAFRAKGPMGELMATFPVRLINRGDAALLGAGRYGWREHADFLGADARR